jgi:hypothetical protein
MLNIKKIIMSLFVASLLFTGCNNQPKPQSKIEVKKCTALTGAPAWVIDPTVDDGIGVLGISSPSNGGISFQIDIARADAFNKVGMEIKTIVIATLDLVRENTKVDISNEARESMKNVTALEVNMIPVSGMKRKNIWTSECTGDLFTHYVIPDNTIKNNVKKTLEKVKASNAIIDKSMIHLDKEIDKIKDNAKNN